MKGVIAPLVNRSVVISITMIVPSLLTALFWCPPVRDQQALLRSSPPSVLTHSPLLPGAFAFVRRAGERALEWRQTGVRVGRSRLTEASAQHVCVPQNGRREGQREHSSLGGRACTNQPTNQGIAILGLLNQCLANNSCPSHLCPSRSLLSHDDPYSLTGHLFWAPSFPAPDPSRHRHAPGHKRRWTPFWPIATTKSRVKFVTISPVKWDEAMKKRTNVCDWMKHLRIVHDDNNYDMYFLKGKELFIDL